MKKILLCTALVVIGALPLSAIAATSYSAVLNPLNNSGVSGTANLFLDGDLLTVNLTAFGLEPNQVHVQHIHGRLDSNNMPLDSTSPTLAQDDDGDGFVELAEGLDTYGPIILQLTSPPGDTMSGFPTAPDGQINYSQTFDLSVQSQFGTSFTSEQLLPLFLREIVVHGMTVGEVGEGTPGEVNGIAEYKPTLPVASGEIFERAVTPVPEPETYAMLLAGLGLLGAVTRRRLKK
jgi:hypothetical protein